MTEKDIEAIVEQKTGIPVGDLKEKEQTQSLNLIFLNHFPQKQLIKN